MNWIQNIKAAAFCSGFMLFSLVANAQNLVPNGDFEYYTACPVYTVNGAPIDFAFPWTSISSLGVSNYSNRCDTVDNLSSVPVTNGGLSYQETHSGNGYGGCHFKYGTDFRDYLEVKFTDSLKAGYCYLVSFYVSLLNFDEIGCNNIAAHLSDTFMHTDASTGLLNASQDIVAFGNPVIIDTSGWFKIAGIYMAHGGEKYITLGDFMDDAHTDTLHQNIYDGYNFSTYYVDDVSVEEVNAQTPKVYAGNDTAINQGDSIFIGTLINGLSTQWYDGNGNAIAANVPGLWVHPSSSTSYVLQQTVCGFTSSDTIKVDVWPLGIKQIENINSIKLFPNPTIGVFNIALPKAGSWTVTVSDVQGRTIPVEQINDLPQLLTVKVNGPDGVYLVRINNNTTGELSIQKLTLQN